MGVGVKTEFHLSLFSCKRQRLLEVSSCLESEPYMALVICVVMGKSFVLEQYRLAQGFPNALVASPFTPDGGLGAVPSRPDSDNRSSVTERTPAAPQSAIPASSTRRVSVCG